MKISCDNSTGLWMVTIKLDHYVQGWVNKNLKHALIVAHAKLLNQMGKDKEIIISSK